MVCHIISTTTHHTLAYLRLCNTHILPEDSLVVDFLLSYHSSICLELWILNLQISTVNRNLRYML